MTIGPADITNDPTIQGLKLKLEAAAMRHEAIASNIANINTPNYKKLDLAPQFEAAMNRAMEKVQNGQMPGEMPRASLSEVAYTGHERFDGNNVNFDQEMVDMVKNQTEFEFAAQVLTQRYNSLRNAITGRSQ